ncbi:MAG: hypothetical protein LUE16_10155 [Lachnospiraceae bacterium]|nr:hypothetical protein [Lachnospiraceae bacterium]
MANKKTAHAILAKIALFFICHSMVPALKRVISGRTDGRADFMGAFGIGIRI